MKKIISLLLLAVLVISGCSSSSGGSNVIVVGMVSEPTTLDTFESNDVPSYQVTSSIYETLTVLDDDGAAQPHLATDWEQDGVEWTFHLRDDVNFSNGDNMTAEDVVFTIETVLVSEKVAYVLQDLVESAEVVDDYTVKITTPSETAVLPLYLSHGSVGIQDKSAYEAGEATSLSPVGTGPYVLGEWISGSSVSLELNDDYWGDAPANDGIEYRIIPEETTLINSLQAGDIDVANEVTASNKDIFETTDGISILSSSTYAYDYMGFNLSKEDAPYSDVKVREAIAYAIDVQAIIDSANVLNGEGTAMATAMPPTLPIYDANLDPYPYDPEAAKELLEEAGYADGFEFELLTADAGVRPQIAEIIQSQLKEVGIDVVVNSLEWGAFLDEVDLAEEDGFLLGWSSSVPDPDYAIYALYSSETHGGSNLTFYSNPDVDAALNAGKNETDQDARVAEYVEVQNLVYEDIPHVPLYNRNQLVGVSDDVTGVKLSPDFKPDYTNATKE